MLKTFTLIALMLMIAVSAFTQVVAVPQQMHFQGRLAKPDGTPVADGNYSIRFSLWTAASGGTEKWNQTINPVTVRSGVFGVQFNTSTGAADKFNGNLFLEIKVGADAPLTPRQPLASVAYAMKANLVPDGSITANSLANNAVTGAKIADNAVTTGKLANGAVTSAKLDSSLQGILGGFTSDTDHTALVGNVATEGANNSVAVSGNYAYVLGYSTLNKTLKIYDVTYPTQPTLRGSIATPANPKAVAVSGNYAYVISGLGIGSLQVFDVSNPASPSLKGSVDTVSTPASLVVSGNHAYVVGGTNNLQIFNVSNPAAPTLQGSSSTNPGTIPTAVAVSGNHVFVTTRGNGPGRLQSFDVSNPAAPVARGFVDMGFDPNCVTASGNYAYVTHDLPNGLLQIYDISNPAAPVFVYNIPTAGSPASVAISGPFAYVACRTGFFQAFYVGNPQVPLYIEGLTTNRGHISVAATSSYVCVVDRGDINNSAMLQVFARPTQGINSNFSNFFARGGGFFYGGLDLDQGALNNGAIASGLTFGPASGEGIASKRTPGGNQNGLDFYTAFQNRIAITNNGKVGIGTTTPTAMLDVNGDLRCIGFTNSSDARFKQNIATLENPLDAILRLRGVAYDWNREAFPDRNFPTGRQIGFLAQEVEKVFPELVSTDALGYKSVAYVNVVPVLVEAVKTLNNKVDRLKKIETENAELKAELAAIKAAIVELKTQSK